MSTDGPWYYRLFGEDYLRIWGRRATRSLHEYYGVLDARPLTFDTPRPVIIAEK